MKNKIGQNWREKLMGNKKFVVLLIFGIVFMMGSVLAIWLISFNGTTGFIVESSSTISISDDFSIETTNQTSTGEVSKMNSITFDNSDGAVDYEFVMVETTDDITSDSCDSSGDASWVVEYDGVGISDGENITIIQGTTFLNATITLKQFSCPANHTAEVTLTPIE